MRVLAKYTGANPAFTKGAKYNFDLKQRRFGHKIDIKSVDRSNTHIKHGQEDEYLNLADFLTSWEPLKLVLSPAETTELALRDQYYGHSWLDRR